MNTMKEFSPISCTIIIALALTVIFSSCKDDDKDESKPNPKYSRLSVIHAASNTGDIDFYVEKKIQNTKPLPYKTSLEYMNVESGEREFSVTKNGKSAVLVKGEFTLTYDRNYSLFITDTTENSMLLMYDDLTQAMPDNARIRFINISPDPGSLDLAVTGEAEPLVTGKSFKQFSDFINTPDVGTDISFEVREHNTGIILYKLSKMKLTKGKDYTFYTRGTKTALGNEAFELSFMVNR